MDRTRLSERCLLTPKPTDLCHSAGPAFLSCVRFRRSSRLCSSPSPTQPRPRTSSALPHTPGVMLFAQAPARQRVVGVRERDTTHHQTRPLADMHAAAAAADTFGFRSAAILGGEVPFVVCVGDRNHSRRVSGSVARRRARRSWSVRAEHECTQRQKTVEGV